MEHLDTFINSFWIDLAKCKHTKDYVMLLELAELTTLEIQHSLQGEEFEKFQNISPLLAMTSEVEMRCPKAVEILAEDNVVFSSALYILHNYTKADRLALRKKCLYKGPYNLIYIDLGYSQENADLQR